MSDSTHDDEHHDHGHTGPIKTSRQLLLTVIFAFVLPVFIIIGLVNYVTSDHKPSGSTAAESQALGGVSAQDQERGVAERIRKVGMVEIRDANRPLKTGEEVFKAQCTGCHTPGAAGAPKVGDAAAWAPRIKAGFDALVQAALKGKGNMPGQGGGDMNDIEIARGVAFMANAAGAKFAEPQPAAAAGGQAPAGAAPAATTTAAASGAAPAAAPAPAAAAAAGGGEALFTQACAACHGAGIAGAPKVGDKAAWAPRIQQGMPALVENAIKGKGGMPPKGGSTASDAEIKAAVEYMANASK
ncbi:c-type cytochrome [Ramlibacter solisilvae]